MTEPDLKALIETIDNAYVVWREGSVGAHILSALETAGAVVVPKATLEKIETLANEARDDAIDNRGHIITEHEAYQLEAIAAELRKLTCGGGEGEGRSDAEIEADYDRREIERFNNGLGPQDP